MSPTIPATHRKLLDGAFVASLATRMRDGSMQVQPVWFGYDGTHVIVNTEKSRLKYRNLNERRHATLLIVNPADVYHWIEIRGVVQREFEDGAREQLDELTKRYLGQDKYPFHQPGDVRVMFEILPTRVVTFGPGA